MLTSQKYREYVFAVFALQDLQEKFLFEIEKESDASMIYKIRMLKDMFRQHTKEVDLMLSKSYQEVMGDHFDEFDKEVVKQVERWLKKNIK